MAARRRNDDPDVFKRIDAQGTQRARSFVVRVIISDNAACITSSVGTGSSTPIGAPSTPRQYTPCSTRQCQQVFRLAAEPDLQSPAGSK
jgi:hypothetical protein